MNKDLSRSLYVNFVRGTTFKTKGYSTKDRQLFYEGNCVAFIKEKTGLWLDSCGWKTKATLSLINIIPDVDVYVEKGQWYINDKEWNGELINVNEFLKENDNSK